MNLISDLKISLFADGANLQDIERLYQQPLIKGFTTNPTLMRKAGVIDYYSFARQVLDVVPDRPISFEVLSDDFREMERQARIISSWGENVFVKIPITNAQRESSIPLIKKLVSDGVKINATALMNVDQVKQVRSSMANGPQGFISVFAGRVADTGRDPIPIMVESLRLLEPHPNLRLIWASPREVLNIFQADAIGCHVITLTGDILSKLNFIGKDLEDLSLETVQMFHRDAHNAGYRL